MKWIKRNLNSIFRIDRLWQLYDKWWVENLAGLPPSQTYVLSIKRNLLLGIYTVYKTYAKLLDYPKYPFTGLYAIEQILAIIFTKRKCETTTMCNYYHISQIYLYMTALDDRGYKSLITKIIRYFRYYFVSVKKILTS